MIIGITGSNGAGKTVTADYLQAKGFQFHSLSDEIRAELAARGEEPTRENLIAAGNRLRAEHGPAVLAERVKARLRPDRNYVIDSIRNPYEVDSLRAIGRFFLLHIDAPQELRYERAVARGDARAPRSFEEFRELEARETNGDDPHGQQLRACRDKADETLINDGDLDDLKRRVDAVVTRRLMNTPRPGWDEYFMEIAKVVSLRANCMKRKVAAVIVRDRRIISTGYNGTPRGVKNCNEGGCPRCNSFVDSGTSLADCYCSHAEENAIVQAAYHGIAVNGATLYSTYSPCLICTKMIINAGIKEVVFNLDYPLNDGARELLREARVDSRKIRLD